MCVCPLGRLCMYQTTTIANVCSLVGFAFEQMEKKKGNEVNEQIVVQARARVSKRVPFLFFGKTMMMTAKKKKKVIVSVKCLYLVFNTTREGWQRNEQLQVFPFHSLSHSHRLIDWDWYYSHQTLNMAK